MSEFVKIKKGFNINLAGKPAKKIGTSESPETFALKPTDFQGIDRPKVIVDVGDNVKAGTPLMYDKKMADVQFTAPVSGEIIEIKRGAKRKLLEIKILADKEIEYESFKKFSASDLLTITRNEAQEQLTKSGVWQNIIQRPFGIVADPEESPRDIYISAFDTHPLAPDYDFLLKGQEKYFEAGVEVLKKFTEGYVNINVNAEGEVSPIFPNIKGTRVNKVSGPHPAGNVGVQIHHLNPIKKGDVVWTVNPFGVAQIGRLFLEGIYDASRVVVFTGSELIEPQYYKTYTGACISNLVENNLKNDHVRFISGNVLTGDKIEKEGYIGYYHNQVTVIPEGDYYEMLGWIKPTTSKLSYHRAWGLLSFLNPQKEFVLDTNNKGEERAFVQTGVFEKVTPMDLFPTHLIKSILAEDYDEMEALGIMEVIEEDLALCEFVDVSKHPIQAILRDGITLIQNS